MTKHITVADLAKELEMDRSTLLKAIRKLGLTTTKVRTRASRGQAMAALTAKDAERMREHYAWRKTPE